MPAGSLPIRVSPNSVIFDAWASISGNGFDIWFAFQTLRNDQAWLSTLVPLLKRGYEKAIPVDRLAFRKVLPTRCGFR